ncbi:MAG: DegT/DnrJ/EryC1/StrS family aminotransferase [Treponema sp.]|nr:DegT/DnrJ/EryC1/StrS family aminotransferase [Treponema sp.]
MWRVQLHKIDYDEREYQAVKEVLDSGWLVVGEKTQSFEAAFSDFMGHDAKCLAVSNGTAALHMALLALGIGSGDEVITPALTFIADQNVVSMVGAKNVLADITSTDDWSIDPSDIEKRITPQTKAVMIVHYAGFACDMERITSLCKKHGLFLIEDCAHSPGADYKYQTECSRTQGSQPLGTFGDISAFSFFANKNIATGEGGMVVTRSEELHKKLRLLRSHGMSAPSFDRYKGRAVSYDVESPGLNYRIHEICSALGLVQLEKLPASNQKRKVLVEHYYSRLDGVSSVSIPYRFFKRGTPNYHIMPVLLSESIDRINNPVMNDGVCCSNKELQSGFNPLLTALKGGVLNPSARIKLIESMKQAGVQASIHYPAIQSFSAYKNKVNPTPKAEYVCAHELTLPLYPGMTIEEVDIVCDVLLAGIEVS